MEDQTLGFKERAKSIGIDDSEKSVESYPSNKGLLDKIKPLEQMEGYIKDESLPNAATYDSKELLTYENFLEKYSTFDIDCQCLMKGWFGLLLDIIL